MPLLVSLYVYNSVAVRYMTCLHTAHEGPKTPKIGVFAKASLWPNVGKFWSAPYRKTRRSQLIDPFFDVFWAQKCVVECRRLHHTFTVRVYNFRCSTHARRRKVIKIWWFSHPLPTTGTYLCHARHVIFVPYVHYVTLHAALTRSLLVCK